MLRACPRGRRLRQPGAAAAAARAAARAAATRRSTTELVGGTLRGQGTYDAVVDHPGRPRRRPAGPRRAAPRRPPAARRCGCPTTPRSPAPSSWCGTGSGTSRPASPTRCCARSPRTTSTAGCDGWTPTRRRPDRDLAVARPTRAGSSRSSRAALGRPERARGTARRRQRAAAGDPGGAARTVDGGGAAADRPTLDAPLGVTLDAATPARCPPCARDGPACRTPGPSWSRSPSRVPRSTAATSAGSTCAPAPAARPRCSPRWRRERGARLLANERQPHRAQLVAPGAAGDHRGLATWSRRTAPGRLGRPWLRPGAGRRAVLRSRCPAAPSREPLAAPSRGPRRPGAAAARAAGQGPRRRSGPGEWCSTRPARPWSPRPPASCGRCSPGATTSASRTRRPLLPEADGRRVGAPAGRRAAVAAPARHRRDVPGSAAKVLNRDAPAGRPGRLVECGRDRGLGAGAGAGGFTTVCSRTCASHDEQLVGSAGTSWEPARLSAQ